MAIVAPSGSGKKKSSGTIKPPKKDDPSVLRQLGGIGLSGLHTVGSVLSTPSRVLWGGINAATGGEGGFGNLDPLDMTGGIQASDVLANQGVISRNDPNQWEWMDPVRGAIDLAGDPTTYIGGLGLTKAGSAAAKAGGAGLSKGLAAQVAKGERGLLSVGLPFRPTSGALLTGQTASKVAGGLEKAGQAIRYSPPGRAAARAFDYTVGPAKQKWSQIRNSMITKAQEKSRYNRRLAALSVARDYSEAGIDSPALRRIAEGTERDPLLGQSSKMPEIDTPSGLKFVPHKDSPSADVPEEMVMVDAAKLDQGWQQGMPNLYIGRGQEAVKGRRAGVEKFLQKGEPIQASRIETFDPATGAVQFKDGRHRFAVLRDSGESQIPVMVPRDIAGDVQAAMGVPGTSPIPVPSGSRWREYQSGIDSLRDEADSAGTVVKGQLQDSVEFAARRIRQDALNSLNKARGAAFKGAQNSGRATLHGFRALKAEDLGRQWYLKGDSRGTTGIDSVLMDSDIDQFLKANPDIKPKQAVEAVADLIEKNHGDYLERTYTTPKGVERDRYKYLAQIMTNSPELRAQGLFGNDPVVDALDYATSLSDRHLAGLGFYEAMAKDIKMTPGRSNARGHRLIERPTTDAPLTKSVRDVLKDRQFTMKNGRLDKAAKEIWERKYGKPVDAKTWKKDRRRLLNSRISLDDYNELMAMGVATPTSKRGWYDSMNSLFKASVLSRPARVVRDHMSAIIQNISEGTWSARSHGDMIRAIRGAPVADISQYTANPEVASYLTSRGIDLTDPEAATKGLMEMFAAARTSMNPFAEEMLQQGAGAAMVGDRTPFVQQIPGALRTPRSIPGEFGQAAETFGRTMIGQTQGPTGEWAFDRAAMNPLNIRGVGEQTQTQFGPVKAFENLTETSDTMNRLQPWLERVRRGEDPYQAMQDVNTTQVNYDPRTFTPTEQQIRRALPFYSFFSRQLPYLAKELLKRPGGGHGTVIKGLAGAGAEDPSAPAHIAGTASIPIPGLGPQGEKQYLTGLGLMVEDPLQFGGVLRGDVAGTTQELLSRMAPLPKTAIELATGESLFQQGFSGGRELSQMDPGAGRLLANIGDWTGLRDDAAGPVRLPGGTLTELAIGNSPLAGPLSIAKQATDTRTGIATKAANLFTGAKISTVSPAAQTAALREKAQILAKELGAKQYAKVYFPPEVLDTLRKSDPIRAAQADAINSLLKELAAGARKQAAERAKKPKGSRS